MINNKNGPPGWLHPPNKGAPRGPSPGTRQGFGDQGRQDVVGYFDRNGRGMPGSPLRFPQRGKEMRKVSHGWFNAGRSVDAVRFEEKKWETIDLSACEAADSVSETKKM